jgi:hypothetical protein
VYCQGLLLLGNISLYAADARDRIINQEKAIPKILDLLPQVDQKKHSLKTILWAIYTLCCPNPLPSHEVGFYYTLKSFIFSSLF